jgi:hypothetical protein
MEGFAALITAMALLLTSVTGIILQLRQSNKANRERSTIIQKTDDVHTIVNSQRDDLIARIEQLEGFIRRRDDTRDNTPPPGLLGKVET